VKSRPVTSTFEDLQELELAYHCLGLPGAHVSEYFASEITSRTAKRTRVFQPFGSCFFMLSPNPW